MTKVMERLDAIERRPDAKADGPPKDGIAKVGKEGKEKGTSGNFPPPSKQPSTTLAQASGSSSSPTATTKHTGSPASSAAEKPNPLWSDVDEDESMVEEDEKDGTNEDTDEDDEVSYLGAAAGEQTRSGAKTQVVQGGTWVQGHSVYLAKRGGLFNSGLGFAGKRGRVHTIAESFAKFKLLQTRVPEMDEALKAVADKRGEKLITPAVTKKDGELKQWQTKLRTIAAGLLTATDQLQTVHDAVGVGSEAEMPDQQTVMHGIVEAAQTLKEVTHLVFHDLATVTRARRAQIGSAVGEALRPAFSAMADAPADEGVLFGQSLVDKVKGQSTFVNSLQESLDTTARKAAKVDPEGTKKRQALL